MVFGDIAGGFAKRIRNGWVLSAALVLAGLTVFKLSYPEVQAGSTLAQVLERGSLLLDVMFPMFGVLLMGAGFVTGLRQLSLDRAYVDRDQEFLILKQSLSQLQERLDSVEQSLDGMKSQVETSRGVIEALTVLATRSNQELAFVGFLDGIVRLCKDRSRVAQDYQFWVKLYTVSENHRLEARYVSQSSPSGSVEHHLEQGNGAAGQFLQAFERNPAIGPQYYPFPAVLQGLDSNEREALKVRGVKSVLCAAVTAHVAEPDRQGRLHFRPVLGPHSGRILFGVLCFCSTLDKNETTLDTQEKKRACQFAANLSGVIFHRHQHTPGAGGAYTSIEVSAG